MIATEVLSMYENIAGLSNQMAAAARMGDWDGLSKLEAQCATEARAVATGVPALSGAPRMRKIDLLKQILANDREIRDIADPWMNQVPGMARQ
ncbi:flagellar protein FliT [Duganella sp. CF517]|uniref:flagellar protein FliT n=1 Tax=Duganella sp. CF517 TaxID=1881038 RepID=UPI0008D51A0F|nr:flagellar protein FliT [Duganella sp. CF517]USX13116.1 flagellar protein FliT [Oxalobacteraceae bacterium OTU3CAMAD1]SEN51493.1 flagellar protein FliT [Duganella sp. CF517]